MSCGLMPSFLTLLALSLSPAAAPVARPGEDAFVKTRISAADDHGKPGYFFAGQHVSVEQADGGDMFIRSGMISGRAKADDLLTAQEAFDHFSSLISNDRPDVAALVGRANVCLFLRRYEQSLADSTSALKADGKLVEAYEIRSSAHVALGHYAQALSDADQAVALAPASAAAHNCRAWVLAAAHVDRFRNAAEAKKSALKACELTGWKDRRFLDTLAAAYAEAGEFDEAVKWQTKAAELAPPNVKQHYLKRLDLYKAERRHRHSPRS